MMLLFIGPDSKFKGRFRNVIEDQPYTREQIKKLVKAAPLRDKCIITLMACSGMRRGAIPLLRLKDVDRIEKYDILKFRVYKNTVHQNAPSL